MKTSFSLALALAAVLLPGARAFATPADDSIESAAKHSYVFRHFLNKDPVKVDANHGNVTLTGTVHEESHKLLAGATVSSLSGVHKVDNRIHVAQKPAEKSDAWIHAKVTTSLMFHRNVSATKTDVSVNKGVVTLRGQASSEAERDLAGEYAKDVDGVKDVHNELSVPVPAKSATAKVGEDIDDASVTAQAKVTLLTHRSTSALNTHVETNHGTVTLTGKAANMAEKDLVTQLIQDIDGVKNVDNQMTY